ncbi:MAG: gliding motility-associated C-terminal domain-containing protein [Flavobacteriales bacterium]
MKNNKIFFLIVISILFWIKGSSQLTNDNSLIHIESKALVHCQDYVRNENSGKFDNHGKLYLIGDWINNGGNSALINSSPGIVILDGGNQIITGSDITKFHNLRLGGGSSIKTITLNTDVTNKLELKDAELQTLGNIMFLSNTNPDSLTWNLGYVSSNELGGYLARSTDTTSKYFFPVGNSGISNIYRAVSITPSTTDSNVFAVRLANIDPTYDFTGSSASGATGGFDLSVRDKKLLDLNTNYYHNIMRLFGTAPAEVGVYYSSIDGNYNSMGQWGGTNNQWNTTNFKNDTISGLSFIGSPDRIAKTKELINFNHDLFVLSETNFDDILSIPQFFSPNGDGVNDTWDIKELINYPNNIMKVFNRWGNLVFEQKGYAGGWNGENSSISTATVNDGNPDLPSGTYFYILDLGEEDKKTYTGFVQLKK